MERYKEFSTQISDRATGKRRIGTISYPKLPFSNTDVYIYSRSGHRLDILAYDYYGDQTLWWVIAGANNLGKGSFNIPPGIRLRIPYPVDLVTVRELYFEQNRS